MSAPEYIDILKAFSYYQKMSEEKYYIVLKVLDGFFLVCINDPDTNIHSLFNWLLYEQNKKNKVFMNKPIKCVFNVYSTSKYKSLLANGGDKIKHILNSIMDYSFIPLSESSLKETYSFESYPFESSLIESSLIESSLTESSLTKSEIKKLIHENLNIIEDNVLEQYIQEDINIESFNKINKDVQVLNLMYHYHFLEFLLTYEVPYVTKDKAIVFLFDKKTLNKFLFDYKFLYYTFIKNEKEKAFNILSLFKKYSES
ncbi:hypothetical protein Yalta_085 [Yalta virus]|nr:hypothetical protein Yalta_085 [Yalta virus]